MADNFTQTKLAFVAAQTDQALQACKSLKEKYGSYPLNQADVIVALGGDGLMLETLHTTLERNLPIYGMNCGTVGFLMNTYSDENLYHRIDAAIEVRLHPLKMRCRNKEGLISEALAINEVSLFRQSRQAAKIRIRIDGIVRLEELVCDGVMVATPAGSTAYNLSAHGPIIPIGTPLLALTPISAFRPRRWRGALVPHNAKVTFEILEEIKRPVSATADYTEIRNVQWVQIYEERAVKLRILFDPEHNLEERILKEQFTP